MSWSAGANSSIFQQAMLNIIGNSVQAGTTATAPSGGSTTGLLGDVINAALFGNSGTPDKTVSAVLSSYNGAASQWVVANETNGGANWPAGGKPLASKAFSIDTGSSSICFQAAILPSGGNVTVTAAYGCLVYDNSITTAGVWNAKQGLCFNYFGGSQSVTAGTFTINWATVGALTNVVVFNISV